MLNPMNRVTLAEDCMAEYGANEVMVTAGHDTEVIVPLPAGSALSGVTLERHDGTEVPHRWSPDPGGILVWVPASTSPSRGVRIRWTGSAAPSRAG